jgi:hypothetical protein
MSRNPLIEALHEARYDLEVLDLLYDDYKEFRRMKRQQEWPKL